MRERHDTGGRSVSLLRRMARFDDLPADQKAVLQLVLRQGRTYGEIAGLLKISTEAVRDRALTALDAIGPDDLPELDDDRQDEIGDYLLGQQSASARAATRELLEGSQPARDWARGVATELRTAGVAGDDALPEIPTDPAEVDEAFDALHARRAARADQARSSRLGGMLIIVAVLLVVVGGVLVLTGVIGGSDDDSGSKTRLDADPDLHRRDHRLGRAADQPHPAQRRQEAARRRQRRLPGRPARAGGRRPGPPGLRPLRPLGPQRLRSRSSSASSRPSPARAPTRAASRASSPPPATSPSYQEMLVTREPSSTPKQPTTIILKGSIGG